MPAIDEFRTLDRIIWAIIAAVAAVVGAACLWGGFGPVWRSFAAPAAAVAVLGAGARFYRCLRNDPRPAAALVCATQMIAFAAVAAPLSYVAASPGLPLQDAAFDTIDRALGLDWQALLAWMNAWPRLHVAFALSYSSFSVQAVITMLALAITGRLVQVRIFIIAFMLAAIVSIAISAVLPAEGAWAFYGVKAADHPDIVPVTRGLYLAVYHGLRDGSVRELLGASAEGIITFPSFHAALGIIFMAALWPVPVLRWIGAVVNASMIAATPIDGSHYFIDVLAGILIAGACLAIAHRIAKAVQQQPHPIPLHASSTPHA